MRCNECNIDLGESRLVCPLCGSVACDDAPKLDGLFEADHPENPQKAPRKSTGYLPSKAVFRISAVVCVLFGLSGSILLNNTLSSLILLGVAVYHFICGLEEKGRLLHSAVGLLATAALQCALLLLGLLLHHSQDMMLFGFIVTLALTVVLYTLRQERFTTQMQALFRY